MKRYQQEFPNFNLDVELPERFEDVSWRNDLCPSFTDGKVIVYVQDADPQFREDSSSERFCVMDMDDEGCAGETVLIQTDSFAEVLSFIHIIDPLDAGELSSLADDITEFFKGI